MIPNFLDRVQQDITYISNYLTKASPTTKEQDEKAHRAALRMLAVVGMAFACATLVEAFTAVTAAAALTKLTTAVILYVLSHDLFTIFANADKGIVDQVCAAGKGLAADAADFLSGKKDLKEGFRHPLSDGTLLRPLWDRVLWDTTFSEQ